MSGEIIATLNWRKEIGTNAQTSVSHRRVARIYAADVGVNHHALLAHPPVHSKPVAYVGA